MFVINIAHKTVNCFNYSYITSFSHFDSVSVTSVTTHYEKLGTLNKIFQSALILGPIHRTFKFFFFKVR